MPRIAGDSRHYKAQVTVRLVDDQGEVKWINNRDLDLISVSTAAKVIDKSDVLIAWAYNSGLEGMLALAEAEIDLSAKDLAWAKAAMKRAGYSPFVKRGRAAERGSKAHEVVEEVLRYQDKDEDVLQDIRSIESEEIRGYCMAAFDFATFIRDTEKAEILLIEEPIVSLRWDFAGTLDLYARRFATGFTGGKPVLSDVKTSKNVYPEMAIQLGGYALGLEELGFEPPEDGSIVLLRPDGSWEEVIVKPDPDGFLAALELSRRLEQLKADAKAAKKKGAS